MKTSNYSKAVNLELTAINERIDTVVKPTSKKGFEMLYAILTLGAVVGLFFTLNALGYIREF